MAVALRSSSVSGVSDTNGTSCVVPVPAGAAAGDIALLAMEHWETFDATGVAWPAGFTVVVNGLLSGAREKLFVAWKRLTGADTGNYTITWTSAQWNMGHCLLITGAVAVGDPIEASNTATGTGTTIPGTSVTTVSQPFLAHFVANETAAAGTPPTSFTEGGDGDYLKTNYRIPATTGTHTVSGGSTSVSTAKSVALIAIKAEGGGASVSEQGTSPVGVATTAAAVKVARVLGVCSMGVASSGTAIKRASTSTRGVVGVVGSASSRKVAPAPARAVVGFAPIGALTKKALPTGRSTVGLATTGGHSRRVSTLGATPFGLVGTQSGLLVRTVSGWCALGLGTAGSARKVASTTGDGSLGVYGGSTSTKRVAPASSCTVGVRTSGASLKRSTQVGQATFAGWSTSLVVKVGAAGGVGAFGLCTTCLMVLPELPEVPPERTWVIPAEHRLLQVQAEVRVLSVAAEVRTVEVRTVEVT